ncbi:MAG: LysE family transporter [Candidatus Omnitrophota bacterium]|nr:LysE family translocator [Candidatus Omnitrophota bacterium]MBU1929070.1 LysE family translocator [Candidatus Omnitrophota bacterium]MBU1929179.1 LysE family translocator [Candidatus Omnitrophota bacterium]MBU2035059.1 LysE family translocator [Candidatus Omnitrophota bacterium]MBU2258256.1 LysE family translocator [Candidatus Omnitrophota bacterium]
MNLNWDILFFLSSVVLISLSGVMMPGPLFAVTVVKGYKNKNSGFLISIGHGIVEIPLMILIYLGFTRLLTSDIVKIAISLSGGLMLIFMGYQMFRQRKTSFASVEDNHNNSLAAGIFTTALNPYFLLWWATIGAALILTTRKYGVMGFILFVIIHWLCDFFWCSFISLAVFKSRYLWSPKVQQTVITICAFVLLGFGGWFIYNVIS